MLRSYKYRLYPTKSQSELMEKTFGCVRYVYNWALERRIEHYQEEKKTISAVELINAIPALKKSDGHLWLNEVSAQSLQQSIRNMDMAFTGFFRDKKGFPKFKSKKRNRSSFKNLTCIGVEFEKKLIQIPKIGKIKFALDRKFTGTIKSITCSKTPTGKYYASVLVETGTNIPEKSPITEETSVGIDVGLKDFAVLSNGKRYSNQKFLEKSEKRLKVLQRRLSRKEKGSKRREKARLAVAKCHERITNMRTNFLHQVTSEIVRESKTVVIEDLHVEGMLKNHCLAKSISSVSWSEFFRQLEYKCEWNGRNLIRIGRFEPSSKMCSCGVVNKELKLSQRTWTCKACGTTHDRDLLAAENIKRFGLIRNTPAGSGEERMESSALVGAEKCE